MTATIASRYVIERELGHGGMATVYLAEDITLGRKVALKVLHPDLAASLGRERFLREIQIAARLTHPHILALHDSGESDGRLFYAMPWVEGESLRQRLEREPQLPVEETTRIVRAVASALEHAHRAGVIHRDIKPENILLAGNAAGEAAHPLVADFGIARALDAASGERLTQTGLALGTPAYMSPEQAAAGGRLDGRSDLYALGCVAYEMLAGAPPFTGPTAQAILARHAVDPVPPLRTVRVVPEPVAFAIERALAKVPADRFATVAEFVDALSAAPSVSTERPRRKAARFAAAGIAIALIGAVSAAPGFWRGRDEGQAPPDSRSNEVNFGRRGDRPTVAVLPFQVDTAGPLDGRFAEAMHQEMISHLGVIRGLTVIDAGSVMQYQDTAAPISAIAKELGVDFLLRGRVRRDSAGVGLEARLIDARSGRESWSGEYYRGPSEAGLGAIRWEVARGIASTIGVKIGSLERARVTGRAAENGAAYALLLRAAELEYQSDPAASVAAAELLKQAIALDSGFAAAVVELAAVYSARSYSLGESRAWADSAIVLAQRAIVMDSTLPDGYRILGMGYLDQGRLTQAAQVYGEVVKLNPSDGQALKVLGWIALLRGRLAEAMPLFVDARTVAPMDPFVPLDMNVIEQLFGNSERSSELRQAARALRLKIGEEVGLLLDEGRVNEAVAEAEQSLTTQPRAPSALIAAARASITAGDYPRARVHLEAMHRIAPDDWNGWGLTYRTSYADVLLRTGEPRRARDLLDRTLADAMQMVETGDERPGVLREIAAIYAAKGDREQAYAWFQRALEAGWRLELIHPSPLLYSLSGDQQFQAVRAEMETDIRREKARLATALARQETEP